MQPLGGAHFEDFAKLSHRSSAGFEFIRRLVYRWGVHNLREFNVVFAHADLAMADIE